MKKKSIYLNIIFIVCAFLAFGLYVFLTYKSALCEIDPKVYWWNLTGTFLQYAIPLYVIVPIISSHDTTDGLKQAIVCFCITLLLSYILKYLINEPRPNGAEYGFPSGHTVAAFMAIFFLARRYGWRCPLFLCTLPLGILVGVSRVLSHYHFIHQVVGGVVLPFITTYLMVKPRLSVSGKE